MYQATPKQHLKLNSWKKLSDTEAELKKSVAYKKKRVSLLKYSSPYLLSIRPAAMIKHFFAAAMLMFALNLVFLEAMSKTSVSYHLRQREGRCNLPKVLKCFMFFQRRVRMWLPRREIFLRGKAGDSSEGTLGSELDSYWGSKSELDSDSESESEIESDSFSEGSLMSNSSARAKDSCWDTPIGWISTKGSVRSEVWFSCSVKDMSEFSEVGDTTGQFSLSMYRVLHL